MQILSAPFSSSSTRLQVLFQMNSRKLGEWFRTTVGERQWCLLSPTLLSIFLDWIMTDALEQHDEKVSIGGRTISNLRFADDIDALAEEEQELEAVVESLDKTCTRYKMEISAEKTKLMANSVNGVNVKRQKLGIITSFKYLKIGCSLNDCPSNCSSDSSEATFEGL